MNNRANQGMRTAPVALMSRAHAGCASVSGAVWFKNQRITSALALSIAFALVGCSSSPQVTSETPPPPTSRSASDLAGQYSNAGLVYVPDLLKPVEAFLDITLGAASHPDAFRGSLVLRTESDGMVLLRVDGARVIRRTKLKKNSDYYETTDGIELARVSEGSGGEGIVSAKVTTKLRVYLAEDARLIIKAREDFRGVGGVLFPLPYRTTRELWYEFDRNEK